MKKGFTLAEVLITLGIIGVVAAITMPTLIGNYKKQVYYTQFRKAATLIEQAFKMYEVDNGCVGNILACKDDHFYAEDIMPYFNVAVKITDDNKEEICKKALEKDPDYYACDKDFEINPYAFITNDGILYNLATDLGAGDGSFIDTNGPNKGPNEYGRDLFIFYAPYNNYTIPQNQIVWGGNESKLNPNYEDGPCGENDEYWGCAAKLLSEGKMNY